MKSLGWFTVLAAATGVWGQAAPKVMPRSRDRAITFFDAKPVLGLPIDATKRYGPCSSDGLTYLDASDTTGASRVLDMYSVSTAGEVRHLQRTVPLEFTNVFRRDFFPGDAALVTLIEAQKRDDPDGRPRETQYYLSVSGHDGDGSKLLALDLRFKPLKAAQFGSGEFLVLGWEEANELEQVAVLKEDGTLRKFIDLDERQTGTAAARTSETMASLSGAALVPFGHEILLTFPGTVRPIRVLSDTGASGSVSLEFPAGYSLHDVLNGRDYNTLVARLQESVEPDAPARADAAPPRQRLFEFVAQTGHRLREFTFDKVPVAAVTCAAKGSLTALFEQPVGDPPVGSPPVGSQNHPTEGAKQLVVGTVRR